MSYNSETKQDKKMKQNN